MISTVKAYSTSDDVAMMRERQSQPTPVYSGRVLSYTHHVRPLRSAYHRKPNRPSRIHYNTYNSPRVVHSSRAPAIKPIPDYVPIEERMQTAVNHGRPVTVDPAVMTDHFHQVHPPSPLQHPVPPQVYDDERSTWDVVKTAAGFRDYTPPPPAPAMGEFHHSPSPPVPPEPLPPQPLPPHLTIHNQVDRNANYIHPTVPPGTLPAPRRPDVFFANDLMPGY